jgi:hypothetical protein
MSFSQNGAGGSGGMRDFDLINDEVEESPDRSFQAASPPSSELKRSLADIKGQAQFLLYLADQIEESLDQLGSEADACHGSFLCKVLSMYSSQLESKHHGLGEKIAEACQEVYVTVREREMV